MTAPGACLRNFSADIFVSKDTQTLIESGNNPSLPAIDPSEDETVIPNVLSFEATPMYRATSDGELKEWDNSSPEPPSVVELSFTFVDDSSAQRFRTQDEWNRLATAPRDEEPAARSHVHPQHRHREMISPRKISRNLRGLALPMTIIAVAGLALLLVGLLTVLTLERKTARSYSDAARADLAVESGLAVALGTLTEIAKRDDSLVFRLEDPTNPTVNASERPLGFREQFFTYGAIFEDDAWKVTPLFSAADSITAGNRRIDTLPLRNALDDYITSENPSLPGNTANPLFNLAESRSMTKISPGQNGRKFPAKQVTTRITRSGTPTGWKILEGASMAASQEHCPVVTVSAWRSFRYLVSSGTPRPPKPTL